MVFGAFVSWPFFRSGIKLTLPFTAEAQRAQRKRREASERLCKTSAKALRNSAPLRWKGSGSFIFEPCKVDLFNFQSLMAAVFVRAALSGGFLADVELSADRLAESFDGDQSRDRTDFHVKRFARRRCDGFKGRRCGYGLGDRRCQ